MAFYKQNSIILLLIVLFLGIILIVPFFSAKAGQTDTSVTVYTQYNFYQNNFGFYSAIDNYSVTDTWPPGDYDLPMNNNLTLAAFSIHQGDIIRLKISLTANADVPMNSARFKLQFKAQGAGCSANETWYDVGGEGSAAVWRGFDIPDLTDDYWMTDDPTMTDSDMNGGYNEFGTSDWNSQPITSGYDIEYDWVIQNNGADHGTTYCFRMVQVDSANNVVEMPSYNRYAEIETMPEPVVNESSTIDYSVGDSFYLTNPDNTQFFIDAPENYSSISMSFEMYAYAKDDIMSTIDAPSGRSTIGNYIYQAQSQKDNFFHHDFDQSVTIQISYNDSDVSGYTESTLQIRRWDGEQWRALSTTVDTVNNIISADTLAFSFFGIFGEEISCGDGSCNGDETCSTCPTDCGVCDPDNGGGGGGGGGGAAPPLTVTTKVILQGKASPAAYLTVLKDGQVSVNTQANSQGDFKVEISNLTAGIYTFGIWAEDKSGLKSITFSFTVNVVSGATTTVSGIFLPPTISLNKDTLKRGETLNISGLTIPQSEVEIRINSEEIIEKVLADTLGDYFYNLNTTRLEEGVHSVRAKASTADGLLSTFSHTLLFGVGVGLPVGEGVCPYADLNRDNKVNLIDFSIMLYWWGRYSECADQNSDNMVNLIDFSIMLYHWTG